MKLLFVGDIVGRPGRYALTHALGRLVDRHCVDLVIANGENAAAGFGLTAEVMREIFAAGVDVITSGNHIWDKKEVFALFEK
ncbi:MAG: YmdB family metallophosphoesterase, partial [Desulfuromonadales bacterium]|nr:YmdB family metallophosphoesterase [Desulfuromonadales bacterium]